MQYIFLIGNLLVFLFLIIFVFFIPGQELFFPKKEFLKDEERVFLSIAAGIVSFVCLAVILGLLKLRVLSLPFCLLFNVYLIKRISFKKLILSFRSLLKNKKLVFLLFLAILLMGFINFPSGFKYNEGIYFWSSQGQ